MAEQGAFTAVAPIDPGKLDSLRNLLMGIGEKVTPPDCPIAFERLGTVHFMRWVILEPGRDAAGRHYPPYLVLSTNFDAPLDKHLDELVSVTRPKFDEIYSHCLGFDPKHAVRYLRDHSIGYQAFYVGTRGRGVAQIRAEERLRDDIQTYLDEHKADLPAKPDELHARLRAQFTTGAYEWVVKQPAGAPPVAVPKSLIFWVGAAVLLATWAVGVFLLEWPWWVVPAVLLAAVALFLIALRAYEILEPRPAVPHTGAPVAALTDREDRVVQNQLTHFVAVKPYVFRRLTLRVVLRVIDLFGRLVFVRGALGGIPSIRFARWVLVDRGRRLLFMSNFDGSWENYLGDFIDKAAIGLTAVWSNSVNCPPAKFLIYAGASDEAAFKAWTRQHQIMTQVWYSAYPGLSVENINNNTRIRLGLIDPLTGARAEQWLALL